MNKKAIIAMSGGVDSSVSALMMLEQGYECTGVTMKLFANEDIGVSKANSCCSIDDVADARSVATSLGMPYYVFNFADRFERDVIDRFVDAYVNGRTPNPCIDCNRYLKFDQLFVRAQELGCDYVVTGHYAQISYDEAKGRYLLRKAVDPLKDQSYVLYSLTQEQLAHAMFPLGGLHKTQVREIAEKHGFVIADLRIVTGDNVITAELLCTYEELIEFQIAVAVNAGVRCSAVNVSVNKAVDNVAFKAVGKVENVVRHTKACCYAAGICYIINGATAVGFGNANIIVGKKLHGYAGAFVALLQHHQCGNAGINAAAHGD